MCSAAIAAACCTEPSTRPIDWLGGDMCPDPSPDRWFSASRAIGNAGTDRDYRLDWLDLVPHVGSAIYTAGRNSGDMLNLPHVYELADIVNSQLEVCARAECGTASFA